MPEATANKIDSEGWVHTRDLGTMDEDGYCKITCRIKELIIYRGEHIYPIEVENFLRTHPLIKDAQVVGVPSEKYGQEVMAFIRVNEEHTLTAEEVRNFCKGKIASWKIPRHIIFVNEYPTTTSGKVQKSKLREMAKKMLDRQGSH
jgi:fatty-acyl-CoA synthase